MTNIGLFDEPDADVARRQAQLRIPLSIADAAAPADPAIAAADADRLADLAGLRGSGGTTTEAVLRAVFDPADLAVLTAQPTPATIWGWSERAATPPIVYVDLAQCRTRGVVLGVLAHELTHLTHHTRRYRGHRDAWWTAVQQLLDRDRA